MIVPLPRAVLFDFDGVVADSADIHHAAWEKAFAELFGRSLGRFPAEEMAGKSPVLIAAALAGRGGRAELADRLYDRKLELLLAGPPPKLLSGVRSLMQLLHKQAIPFGIASNAPGAFVRRSAELLKLPVAVVLGVDDFERPKPAPDPYWQLAGALGVEEVDYPLTWVLEDSPTGMRAAVAAGMFAIGIADHRRADELLDLGARTTYVTPAGVAARLRASLLLE